MRLIRIAVALIALLGGGARALWAGDAPSAEQVSAAFVELYNYEYGSASPEAIAVLKEALRSVPGADEAVSAYEAREVFRNGKRVAVVMIAGIDPDSIDDDPFAGVSPAPGSISLHSIGGPNGGFNAIEVTTPTGYQTLFYDEDGLVIQVVSPDRDHTRAITSRLGLGNL